MNIESTKGAFIAITAIFASISAASGPDIALNQYVSPNDWAPDLQSPGDDYKFLSFAGYAWEAHESQTHRVWLGNAFGDRFLARTYEYCTGEAFGRTFECFEDRILHLYDRSQINVQPLYKCFDAVKNDTYISWFEHCQEPGINGQPTGEGPYPYESGMPDHFLGYLACTPGPFFFAPQYDQFDSDGDGVFGDCDIDVDNDGIENPVDNCPRAFNPDQADNESDGLGDACDSDDDNDSVDDELDNCLFAPNPGQEDWDGNGVGDACDDSDSDGVFDDTDNCRVDPNSDQADYDNNGIGDVCDNADDDMLVDANDNCITIPNNDQQDSNADGFGNRCDADLNNDCIVNVQDLALLRSVFFSAFPNADFNGDGVVNVIDLGIMRTLFFEPPGPSLQTDNCR